MRNRQVEGRVGRWRRDGIFEKGCHSLLDAMGLSDISGDDGLYKVYLFNTAEDR